MNAIAIRPAVISAPGKPFIHLGMFASARRSRMQEKRIIARPKPAAAQKPLNVLSSRL